MDRNFLLALMLSLLVVSGWQMWEAGRRPPAELAEQAAALADVLGDPCDRLLSRPLRWLSVVNHSAVSVFLCAFDSHGILEIKLSLP